MDLWQAIKEDHRRVDALFGQLEDGPGDRDDIMRLLTTALDAHTLGEEKAVYPELCRIDELKGLIDHSREEHREVRSIPRPLEKAGAEEFNAAKEAAQSVE